MIMEDPTAPTEVDGAQLLDEVRAYATRFIVFPSGAAADAYTLWAAHTHAVDLDGVLLFDCTPRLAILGESDCGKTLALEILGMLSRRGLVIADPTAPTLAFLISEERATLMIDEIDMLLGPGDGQRPLRTVLNVGYQRSGKIARLRQLLSCFAPVALAGLPQNFQSNIKLRPTCNRSIILRMRAKRAQDGAEDFKHRMHVPMADALSVALAEWTGTEDVITELACAWPESPEGVENRLAQIWEPLFALADVAGGDWPERARAACKVLALGDGSDAAPEPSPLQRLLADLSTLDWGPTGNLPTRTILAWLYGLPDSPWRTLWPNPGAAPRELAALLGLIGVHVDKVWDPETGRSVQGYHRTDFGSRLPDAEPAEGGDTAADQEPSGPSGPSGAIAIR